MDVHSLRSVNLPKAIFNAGQRAAGRMWKVLGKFLLMAPTNYAKWQSRHVITASACK